MYNLFISKNAEYIELDNCWNRVFMLFETNYFSRFIWWVKKAPTVLTYNSSNVKAHAMKKAVKVPQKRHQYLRLRLEKKMVRTNTLASQVYLTVIVTILRSTNLKKLQSLNLLLSAHYTGSAKTI